MPKEKPLPPQYYQDYLSLEKILDSQDLISDKFEQHAHDEMLFIIIHQIYELWFKQILYELDDLLTIFGEGEINEAHVATAVTRLDRIIEIQKILIDQIRVLETMTPMDFLDFRDFLIPASGFQSLQFRLIENKLGLLPGTTGLVMEILIIALISMNQMIKLSRTVKMRNHSSIYCKNGLKEHHF